jgi:hypothetical protein
MWSHQKPVPPLPPDDLTIIEGIGDEVEKLLNANGVTTFEQLSKMSSDEDLTKINDWLDKRGWKYMDPKTWPKQAELAGKFIKATGKKADLDKFNEYTTYLKDGISPDEYNKPEKERKPLNKRKKIG